MNEETIGMNAGAVWNALNEAQVLGSKQLKKVTKLKDKELYAAIEGIRGCFYNVMGLPLHTLYRHILDFA